VTPRPVIEELRSGEEVDACVALLRAAFATVAEEFGLTEETAPTNAAFATRANLQRHIDSGLRLFGMKDGTALIGCVGIRPSKADTCAFTVERLAVLPASRHRGHGRQLMDFALRTIGAVGGRTASIGVMDTNERLKAWYRSMGFAPHDRRRIPHLPFKVCFMARAVP
jgi:diamine N-acetyltransferase